MNRFIVDQKTFEYIRFIGVEPKMVFEGKTPTNEQDTNKEGIPLWTVTVLAKQQGAAKAETLTVKIAADKLPNIPDFSPIGFVNLTAYAYSINDRAALALSAEKMGLLKD